ncbi:hypothetical protein FACS1894159_05200 [Bacteroidia bacterium]|nr:hypothetical protein FACS1894159_05200 [Bacteroidia bacterium]
MNKLLTILGNVAAVALLATSCATKEEPVGKPQEVPQATLTIPPITRADGDATADELKINTARLVIFRTPTPGVWEGGQLVANRLKSTAGELAQPFHESVPVGKIDIYLIVNENVTNANTTTGWTTALNSTSLTEAVIENLSRTWSTYATVNSNVVNAIPMFNSYKGVDIAADGTMTYNGAPLVISGGTGKANVLRSIAKVIVNIDFDNGGQPFAINSLNVMNIPTVSWLAPRPYPYTDAAHFFNGANLSPAINAAENLNLGKPNRKYTFYLPEYLLTEPYWRTKIHLVAANKSFDIVLGDGMGDPLHDQAYMAATNLHADLRISRNTCYIINIMSITGDVMIVFSTTVMAWNYIDVPVE